MLSTPAVWKQYNKMAVLHFFLVNSSLYILFSMAITLKNITPLKLLVKGDYIMKFQIYTFSVKDQIIKMILRSVVILITSF